MSKFPKQAAAEQVRAIQNAKPAPRDPKVIQSEIDAGAREVGILSVLIKANEHRLIQLQQVVLNLMAEQQAAEAPKVDLPEETPSV